MKPVVVRMIIMLGSIYVVLGSKLLSKTVVQRCPQDEESLYCVLRHLQDLLPQTWQNHYSKMSSFATETPVASRPVGSTLLLNDSTLTAKVDSVQEEIAYQPSLVTFSVSPSLLSCINGVRVADYKESRLLEICANETATLPTQSSPSLLASPLPTMIWNPVTGRDFRPPGNQLDLVATTSALTVSSDPEVVSAMSINSSATVTDTAAAAPLSLNQYSGTVSNFSESAEAMISLVSSLSAEAFHDHNVIMTSAVMSHSFDMATSTVSMTGTMSREPLSPVWTVGPTFSTSGSYIIDVSHETLSLTTLHGALTFSEDRRLMPRTPKVQQKSATSTTN